MNNIKYAAYIRKSTEGDERQKLSIEAQKDKIKEYFSELDILWFEESKSAFKPYQRPVFQRMLTLIQNGDIKGLVAWHPDRISRNEVDASAITWAIRQNLIQDVKFASFNFDNSPEGMMMLQMTMSQSQYFSAKLSKDVKRGVNKKIRIGQLAGRAPEGYINNKADKTTELDPLRHKHIRKVFDMYLSGDFTIPEIKKMLDDSGYLTIKRSKVGGTKIARSTIYKILTNPRYCGRIPNPSYPDDIDLMYKADFPAIITVGEYLKIQGMLGTRGRSRYVTKKQFELKGIFKCGECGCSITAERKSKLLKNGSINYHVYYHCTRKKPCAQRNIAERELFGEIDSLLKKYELPTQLYKWGLEAIENFATNELELRIDSSILRSDKAKLIKTKLSQLLDHLTDGNIDPDEFKLQKAKLKAELKSIEQISSEAIDKSRNWHEVVGKALDKLHSATDSFKEAEHSTRKDIVNAIGYNPQLIDKRIRIIPYEWLKPILDVLPETKTKLDEVITDQDICSVSVKANKKDLKRSLKSSWQGHVESNHDPRFWRPMY